MVIELNSLSKWYGEVIGLNNLTGTGYAHHVNAQNPFDGTRIPEPGRTFYIRLRYGL